MFGGWTENVRDKFSVAGVDMFLKIHDELDAAVASF
jgi:hypothetical protein